MRRGTTPEFTFTLPFEDVTIFEEIWITFSQDGKEVYTIDKGKCKLHGSKIKITLTQMQTLQLSSGKNVEIQIRVKTADGTAMASNVITTTVYRILKDGEI